MLQAGEEPPDGQRRRLGDLSQEPTQPPNVDVQGGRSAAGDALGQQERLDSGSEGVNTCFFGGLGEGLNG